MGTRGGKISSRDRKRARYNDGNENDSGIVTRRVAAAAAADRFSQKKVAVKIFDKLQARMTDERNDGITSIPIEILFQIMSYLDCRDLYSLRGVSKYFERLVLEPSVWTAYEVGNAGPSTSTVIQELKRMPNLRKISIEARNDCDLILKQLSRSNKKLQRLNISNCTGASGKLYLTPGFLIRILEKCTRLHTITIRGSRFRGLKFYRLLGNIGHRLKFVATSTTRLQFRTFAQHVNNLEENERKALCSMCPIGARIAWGPLRYYAIEKSDRTKTALVSYFYHDFLYVDLRPDNDTDTRIETTIGSSPVNTCT